MSKEKDNFTDDIYRNYLFHKALPKINSLEFELQNQKEYIKHLEFTLQNSKAILLAKKVKSLLNLSSNKSARHATNPIIDPYKNWLETNPLAHSDYDWSKSKLKEFSFNPKFTIVVDVKDFDEKALNRTVNSLKFQIYENFEVLLLNDSSDKVVNECLQKICETDARITQVSSNMFSKDFSKHISGEFVAFVNTSDVVHPDALFYFALNLNKNLELDFIYSDEDFFDSNGEREKPNFKPDWSPELILSVEFTRNLHVYRKSILDEIGYFNEDVKSAKEYDLLLRFTERIAESKISHIPRILFTSGTKIDDSDNYESDAKKSLANAVKRKKIAGNVENGLIENSFRVRREIKANPKVSIIIPTKDSIHLLANCIDSIQKSSYKNYEIIVINNKSEDAASLKYFDILISSGIKVLDYNKPFNYATINNFAVREASGEHLLFLNNDMEVITKDWIESLLEFSQQEEIGCVGAKLLYPNNTIQHAGVIASLEVPGHAHRFAKSTDSGYMNRINLIQNFSAVTAACLMVKKSLFERVRGFDENFVVAFNDLDLCLKILDLGLRNVYTPFAELYHYESQTRGQDDNEEKKKLFFEELDLIKKKWPKYTSEDPYYNRNLTKYYQNFGLS